jgi:hypothetical protein
MQIKLSYQYIFIMKATILDTHGRIGYGLGWEKNSPLRRVSSSLRRRAWPNGWRRRRPSPRCPRWATCSRSTRRPASKTKTGSNRFLGHKWTLAVPEKMSLLSGRTSNFNFKNLNLPRKFTYPYTVGDFLDRGPGSTGDHITPALNQTLLTDVNYWKIFWDR